MNRINESKIKEICIGSVSLALIMAIAVFIIMLYAKRSILAEASAGDVYVAINTIPAGTVIDEDNLLNYMKTTEIADELIPASGIRMSSEIKGMMAVCDIDKGSILTLGMFKENQDPVKGMKAPVVVGLKAEDLYQLDNGILRGGDRIHIYGSDEEGNVRLRWSNIYVVQTFDEEGRAIDAGNNRTSAKRINLYMEKADVESFYTGLESGNLRAVKALQ